MGDDIVCSTWEHVANTRLVYGGSAYSYANDPDFAETSTSEEFWQGVIDKFYSKYKTLAKWHTSIVQGVIKNRKLVMPTGRVYNYEMKPNYRGELKAPETIIKNYPVQGLGADIMAIIRVEFFKMWKQHNIQGLLVNTVHDSIVCDIHPQEKDKVVKMFNDVFEIAPSLFKERFGVEFNLPLRCEIGYGANMKELTEV